MILKLDEVEKDYPGSHMKVSLEVQEGCITGLVGQNGAGKSTTFKAILDLIYPDGGRIELFGKDHRSLDAADKEEIGVVFADAGFSAHLTVRQLIPVLGGLYSRFHPADFLEKCRRFGLPENYPQMVMERGGIDEILLMVIGGEKR